MGKDESRVERVQEKTTGVLAAAKARASITTDAQCEEADVFVTETIVPLLREAAATFDPIIKKAHEAHREAIGQKKKVTKPLEDAKEFIDGAIAAYRRRREEEAREAREAEVRRQLAEAQKRRDELVEELQDEGLPDEAAKVAAEPVPEPELPAPPPAPASPPLAETTSVRRTYSFKITDESKIDRKYMTPDKTAIGKVVRAMPDDAADLVGGIEVIAKETLVRR